MRQSREGERGWDLREGRHGKKGKKEKGFTSVGRHGRLLDLAGWRVKRDGCDGIFHMIRRG